MNYFYTDFPAGQRLLLSCYIVLLSTTLVVAQTVVPVSVQQDTAKISLLTEIAREIQYSNPEQAREYFSTAASLARQLSYTEGLGRTYRYWGELENNQRDYATALLLFQKAVGVYEKLDEPLKLATLYTRLAHVQQQLQDEISALDNFHLALHIYESKELWFDMARIHHQICLLHYSLENYPEALNHIYSYLKISEQFEDERRMATAFTIIGNIKSQLGQANQASEFYEKALQIIVQAKDTIRLSELYLSLGNAKNSLSEQYDEQNNTEQALQHVKAATKYYNLSLPLLQYLRDTAALSECYVQLGVSYKNAGSLYRKLKMKPAADSSWQQALVYFDTALQLDKNENVQSCRMGAYNGIGDVWRRKEQYDQALIFTQKYLQLALENGDQKFIQQGYKDLSRVYAALGQYKEAYEFRKKYDEMRYATMNEQRIKDFERREVLYGDRQKQVEIERQRQELQLQEAELRQATIFQNSLIGGSVFLLLLVSLLYYAYHTKNRTTADLAVKNHIIEAERQRAEELLLNILPEETARELQTYGRAKAKRYNSTTVMFIDFKSFTRITEILPPEELVQELDECFRVFDAITTRFNIEKIKTVGDSYVCAGGLPTPNTTHHTDVVRAALVIQQWMEEYKERRQAEGRPYFEARIGIHTGSVVAGIVGDKKFAYDIWGDTVNMAARIEASGEVGRVNISETTYALVQHQFNCINRGKIQAKNKGEVNMYFVESGKLVVMENRA